MTALAPTLQAFFTERLMASARPSHTIAGPTATPPAAARLRRAKTGKAPSALDIADLDAPLVAAFLDHLEARPAQQRRAPATPGWPRSTRCSATPHCDHPEHAAVIQRVLAIPAKRCDKRTLVTCLTAPEVDALLAAPDRGTWDGRRDHALLLLAVQTGLRVSELTGLDLRRRRPRRRGARPLHRQGPQRARHPADRDHTVAVLRAWLAENPGGPDDPLFPTRTRTTAQPRRGRNGSLAKHAATAARTLSHRIRPANTSPHTSCVTPRLSVLARSV